VPSLALKKQWQELLTEWNIEATVKVINTASKEIDQTDLLVVDEMHRAAGETFINLFDKITYNKLIWLTATIERQDGRHLLLLEKAPIVDEVTLTECRINNWISNFNIYLLTTSLIEAERKEYDIIDSGINTLKEKINPHATLLTAEEDIKYFKVKSNPRLWTVYRATSKVFLVQDLIKQSRGRSIRAENFRTLNSEEKNMLYLRAVNASRYYNLLRQRKSLTNNTYNKNLLVTKLIDLLKGKTIIFAQDIKTVKDLAVKYPNAATYHSKQSQKVNESNLLKFTKECDLMLSVKALNAGIDVPEITNAVIISSTASKIDATQIIGRSIRYKKNKVANIIFLYAENTQDEVRLLNSMYSKKFSIVDYESLKPLL